MGVGKWSRTEKLSTVEKVLPTHDPNFSRDTGPRLGVYFQAHREMERSDKRRSREFEVLGRCWLYAALDLFGVGRIWGIAFGGRYGVRNKLARMNKSWPRMATYNLDGYLSDVGVSYRVVNECRFGRPWAIHPQGRRILSL